MFFVKLDVKVYKILFKSWQTQWSQAYKILKSLKISVMNGHVLNIYFVIISGR